MAEGMTAHDLALDLGFLQADDVTHTVSEHLGLDVHDDAIPAGICAEVRRVLDPHGERTAPAHWYWPGHPRDFSPERGEGLYEGVFDW